MHAPIRFYLRDSRAVEPDPAACRPYDAGYHVRGRGFPGTVRAEHRHQRTFLHVQREVSEDIDPPVPGANAFNFEQHRNLLCPSTLRLRADLAAPPRES